MNLRPAQVDDLAPAASGEQQKADDVGLRPAFLPGLPVQDPVQAGDLLPGQEPRELRAPVERDALRRIAFDVAAGNGEVQHLPKAREGDDWHYPARSGCSGRTSAGCQRRRKIVPLRRRKNVPRTRR